MLVFPFSLCGKVAIWNFSQCLDCNYHCCIVLVSSSFPWKLVAFLPFAANIAWHLLLAVQLMFEVGLVEHKVMLQTTYTFPTWKRGDLVTCDAFSSLLQNPQQLHGQFLAVTKYCLQLPTFEWIGSRAQFCCLVSWVSSSCLTVW